MGAVAGVPHPFPYQGSKRRLASRILACLPRSSERLLDPFVGSGAVTLATAFYRRARHFVVNDINPHLIRLWRAIIEAPEQLADDYERSWKEQVGQERGFYDRARAELNATHRPHLFLYLLARCVKAAVRYNGDGEFNNSPDNRRLGMRPATMRRNLLATSALLQATAVVTCQDYRAVLAEADRHDTVYLDPPYQGVSATRDPRYCGAVHFDELVTALDRLNRRQVAFLVSYDGRTGEKAHGRQLPSDLRLTRLQLPAGRSSQATLLGRAQETVESLYLSPALVSRLGDVPNLGQGQALTLFDEIPDEA